jgi:hypothetical protein
MPGYQLISAVAASLSTDDATLLDFQRKNWIRVVNRNGNSFLASDQRYRAKYILHLHAEKHLTDDQIDLVLSIQRPPYSAAEVDDILKQNPLADRSQHADD